MAKRDALTVVNISRDRLSLCSTHSPTPLILNFSTSAVLDLEIINPQELTEQIKGFVAQNQIKPTHLVLIMGSDVCFEKDLTGLRPDETVAQTQMFIDKVPIASVSSKIFKSQNHIKLIVINRFFYQSIKDAFDSLGFIVEVVVPGFVMQELGFANQFDTNACLVLFKKVDFLRTYSFISPDVPTDFHGKRKLFFQGHSAILVILSLIGVLFLGFTAWKTLRKPTASKTPTVSQNTAVQPKPKTTVVPEESAIDKLTIQISAASTTSASVASISSQLKTLGLVNQTISVNPTKPANTLIVFRPHVGSTIRDQILSVVRQLFPAITVQENNSGNFDVSLTVSQ
jgi:hypothetical protein